MLPEAWVAGVLLGDVATMDETDYQCGLLQKKNHLLFPTTVFI
jgi:hypothetical protein